MELQSQTNTFTAGMNIDSDLSMIADNQYRWAENVRLITDNNGTTGALLNIEDIRKYEGGLDATEMILGTAVTRWFNVVKQKTEECGVVFTYELYDGNYINNLWVVTGFESTKPVWELIVSADINVINKVSIVTNYESNSVSNVYITDGNSSIKVINILKKYNTTKKTPILDSTYFDLLPSATLAPFRFVLFTSGAIPIGMVQYCYQLFNVHGSETMTSSMSKIIPINEPSGSSSKQILGGKKGDSSSVGCLLNATILNSKKFDRVRVIRVLYKDNVGNIDIDIINESDLPVSSDATITFNYTDQGTTSISRLTLEEFNDIIPFEFSAKSIAKLDNRLFASNVQESTWDIAYDARAFRCNSFGEVLLKSSTGNDINTTLSEILSSLSDLVIPFDHDCINPMNEQLLYPDNASEEYAFGYDGGTTIRGGKGFNIQYRFATIDMIESDNLPTTYAGKLYLTYNLELSSLKRAIHNVLVKCPENGQTIINHYVNSPESKIRNYSDPYFVSNFLSHQRDETYRYGIVLYNTKNIPSPVHWIGDIRFPSADVQGYLMFDFASTVDGTGNYELVSHPIGLIFEVSNLPAEVSAYEIVRCKRNLSDRSVITQGLLNKTQYYNGWEGDTDNFNGRSIGTIDRRPYIVPTYSKNMMCVLGAYFSEADKGPGNVGVDKNAFMLQDKQIPNRLDTYGIFDFVSSDTVFNKEKADTIVTDNMKIVPLFCVSSVARCTHPGLEHIRMGIPFDTKMSGKSFNPFGGVAKSGQHLGDGSGSNYGIFDGLELSADRESGGVCKYYLFFNKGYAISNLADIFTTNRIAVDVTDVAKATDINPYIQNVEDIKKYVDYISAYGYINCSMGSYEAYGPHGPALALSAPGMYLAEYKGITTTPYGDDYCYNATLLVNIKKNIALYGGNTYANRQNSIYISTGSYVKSTFSGYTDTMCFGGDTYLGVLDYTYTYMFTMNDVNSEIGKKRYVGAYIPLESSVNMYYRLDQHFSQQTTVRNDNGVGGTANIYYMAEPGLLNSKYVQKLPAYTYNSAYSAQSTAKNYVQKSMYAEDNIVNNTRITCSELKTNNEITDSWTKFKFANYIDVDSQYGQITNIKIFKNRLYYFLDSAVGIASVNDRSLINDNNAGQLVLGTGGILTRFDYLVTLNGNSIINDKSIVNSETTIYWHDYDKNVLCALNNDFLELSKVKQVLTYLNRLPDNARKNPVSFYDKKYNEIWFKIYDRCLIFNELLNVFTSFYTHNPNWFFPFSTKLITIKDNNCYYLHNMYEVNSDIKEDKTSYVRFVVNKDITQTKVFDNQSFTADLTYLDSGDPAPVIKNIYFKTIDLETEPIDYTQIDYREHNYRFPIGREKQNNQLQQELTNMSYAGRMRGKYLLCNYTFDCNNNRQFKLPYLKTTYRYSML